VYTRQMSTHVSALLSYSLGLVMELGDTALRPHLPLRASIQP
jgi:hypothetical protein